MPVISIADHMPKRGEKYLLDCNVLMYNFYTNGDYGANLLMDYSMIVTKVISADAELLMTDVLLSEFVNTYVQTEFHRLAEMNGWSHSKRYFKHIFKGSDEYKDILRELRIIFFRQICPVFTLLASDFPHISLEGIFERPDTFDFNDRYYGLIAKKAGAFVVTNDADFSDVPDIDIITNNTALLQSHGS